MLYTLSHSPNQCDLPALLRLTAEGDALLLLQDGVLAGLAGSAHLELLLAAPHIPLRAAGRPGKPGDWLVISRTKSLSSAIITSLN